MKTSLQKFKIASEFAPIHIIFTDTSGKILYANKAVEDVTGYSRREIIGNNPRLWGRQMPPEFYKKLWKTIKKDKKVFRGEIKNKRKNGEYYTALARIAPALDEKGSLVGFVGIEQDITKEKQVDQAKTEFVSLASHQLRNSLTVIKLYSEMLLKNMGLDRKQKKYISEINNANKKMIDLVSSLLDVSKIELGKFTNEPRKIELATVVKSIMKDFMPKIRQKRIILEEKYSGKNSILIDPKMLIIILQNLISNAVKYTPKLGKIKLGVFTARNILNIKVSDTGYGIPKKDQGRIFEKMYRAPNAQKKDPDGTGLGLYMIKSLINQKNGKIWFESKEGKGTVFYVRIPLFKQKL